MKEVILDLETQQSFDDVGIGNVHLLKISVAVIYLPERDEFKIFTESDIPQLLPILESAALIIGFNIRKFDYRVLESYFKKSLDNLPTLDILEEVERTLGYRLKLDTLVTATLGEGKTGSGFNAIRFFREGQMEKLADYCKNDVRLTWELYEYGKNHGRLFYRSKFGYESIPIRWAGEKKIIDVLKESYQNKATIEIKYLSLSNERSSMIVDIYWLGDEQFVAFCHFRKKLRTFNVRRVLNITTTTNKYHIPADFRVDEYIGTKGKG